MGYCCFFCYFANFLFWQRYHECGECSDAHFVLVLIYYHNFHLRIKDCGYQAVAAAGQNDGSAGSAAAGDICQCGIQSVENAGFSYPDMVRKYAVVAMDGGNIHAVLPVPITGH